LGMVETNDEVPAESGGIQPVKVAANLPDSGGGEDDSSPAASSESGGSGGGGACFIGTASSQPFDPFDFAQGR
jgi:hypothetical protein